MRVLRKGPTEGAGPTGDKQDARGAGACAGEEGRGVQGAGQGETRPGHVRARGWMDGWILQSTAPDRVHETMN